MQPEAARTLSFRALIASASLDGFSDHLLLIGLIWYVFSETHSASATGFMVASFEIPAVVTGLLAGRIIDRYQSARLFAFESAVRAMLIALIPVAARMAPHQLLWVYCLAIVIGALQPLQRLRDVIMIPRIAAPADVPLMNRALVLTAQFTSLCAPAAAGAIVGFAGVIPALLLSCGMAAMGTVALLLVKVAASGNKDTHEDVPSISDCLKLFKSRPALGIVTAMSLIFFFAYGPLEAALPTFAAKSLASGAQGLGILWTSFGIGSFLGVRFFTRLYEKARIGFALPLIAVLWGLFILPFAVAFSLPIACLLFACAAALWSPYTVLERTLIQRLTPNRQLGTFYGMRTSLAVAGTPAGTALGGILLSVMTPRLIIALSGALCIAAGIGGLLSRPLRDVHGFER